MSDGPEWFAQKRYGYGATPVTWQGWAITATFVAAVAASSYVFLHKPVTNLAIIVPLTLLLTFVTIKTTKGGWRWRWGDRD